MQEQQKEPERKAWLTGKILAGDRGMGAAPVISTSQGNAATLASVAEALRHAAE